MDIEITKPKGPWQTRIVTVDGKVWGKIRKVAGVNRHYQVICDQMIYNAVRLKSMKTNTVVCMGYFNAKAIVEESIRGTYYNLVKGA